MTTLTDYKRSEQLGLDELLAVIEREETEPIEGLAIAGAAGDPGRNGHNCAVEAICHAGHGINGGGAFPYVCGFRIVGTTWGCPRRRRLEVRSGVE